MLAVFSKNIFEYTIGLKGLKSRRLYKNWKKTKTIKVNNSTYGCFCNPVLGIYNARQH